MKDEIIKRITFLETQLMEKKAVVDKELHSITQICKELIALKEKLENE